MKIVKFAAILFLFVSACNKGPDIKSVAGTYVCETSEQRMILNVDGSGTVDNIGFGDVIEMTFDIAWEVKGDSIVVKFTHPDLSSEKPMSLLISGSTLKSATEELIRNFSKQASAAKVAPTNNQNSEAESLTKKAIGLDEEAVKVLRNIKGVVGAKAATKRLIEILEEKEDVITAFIELGDLRAKEERELKYKYEQRFEDARADLFKAVERLSETENIDIKDLLADDKLEILITVGIIPSEVSQELDKQSNKVALSNAINNLKQMYLLLFEYDMDYGKYPDDLIKLQAEGYVDAELFGTLDSSMINGKATKFTYRRGYSTTSDEFVILMHTPKPIGGMMACLFNNGSVKAISREEFDEFIKAQK